MKRIFLKKTKEVKGRLRAVGDAECTGRQIEDKETFRRIDYIKLKFS